MGYQKLRMAVQLAALVGCFLTTVDASAHQTIVYQIGGQPFVFNIGIGGYAQEEYPILTTEEIVWGQLIVIQPDQLTRKVPNFTSVRPTQAIPNIADVLRAEVIFGNQSKPLTLSAAPAIPSGLPATIFAFIPTTAGVYTLRFSGTINGVPVDLKIPCNPAGHVMTPASIDATPRQISDQVTQTHSVGSIACPGPRSAIAFPGGIASNEELQQSIRELDDALGQTRKELSVLPLGSRAVPYIALIGSGLGFAALLVALIALWRTRSKNQLPY